MIPFVIILSKPDYKRPTRTVHCDDASNLNDMNAKIAKYIHGWVLDDVPKPKNVDEHPINYFIEHIYDNDYIDDLPLEIIYYHGNQWNYFSPQSEEFLKYYSKMYPENKE